MMRRTLVITLSAEAIVAAILLYPLSRIVLSLPCESGLASEHGLGCYSDTVGADCTWLVVLCAICAAIVSRQRPTSAWVPALALPPQIFMASIGWWVQPATVLGWLMIGIAVVIALGASAWWMIERRRHATRHDLAP